MRYAAGPGKPLRFSRGLPYNVNQVIKMRLLIVEDELDLAEALAAFLENHQYIVDTVHDGRSGYDYASSGNYDAVILDIMLPQMDGIEVLKLLRAKGIATPVMMLTAKGEKEDRIKGFDTGADDYLPKPFDPDELLARVRAMLRRGGGYTPNVIAFGDLALDCREGILRCGNRSERLSGREFQVMELFMRAPRAIVSAERIMERIWGINFEGESRTLDVHIKTLRQKLKSAGALIKTVRNVGYIIE